MGTPKKPDTKKIAKSTDDDDDDDLESTPKKKIVDEDEDFASQIESYEYIIPHNEELYLLVKYYKPRK